MICERSAAIVLFLIFIRELLDVSADTLFKGMCTLKDALCLSQTEVVPVRADGWQLAIY